MTLKLGGLSRVTGNLEKQSLGMDTYHITLNVRLILLAVNVVLKNTCTNIM